MALYITVADRNVTSRWCFWQSELINFIVIYYDWYGSVKTIVQSFVFKFEKNWSSNYCITENSLDKFGVLWPRSLTSFSRSSCQSLQLGIMLLVRCF